MKNKKKKRFLCGAERFAYKFCFFIIILLVIGIVCGQTSLAQINLEVQKLSNEVSECKDKNDSLNMKIDEMTSLDKIEEISREYGLVYHSENIKTID